MWFARPGTGDRWIKASFETRLHDGRSLAPAKVDIIKPNSSILLIRPMLIKDLLEPWFLEITFYITRSADLTSFLNEPHSLTHSLPHRITNLFSESFFFLSCFFFLLSVSLSFFAKTLRMLYRHSDGFKVAYDSSEHKLVVIEKKLIFYVVNFLSLHLCITEKSIERSC